MFCPKCGQSLPDDAAFCFRCGQPMQQVSDALGQGVPHTQNQQAQMPKAQNPYVAQNQQHPPTGYPPVGNRMSSGPMTTPWGSTSVWQQPMPKQQQAAVPPQGYAPPQQPNPAPPQVEELSEQNRNLVPDHNFSKFIDQPDPPLPFHIPKVIIGIITLLSAGFLILQCQLLGTFRLIMGHATDNIRGMSLLIVAILLAEAGITSIASKMSRGAAGTSAICYFLGAGFSFIRLDDFKFFMFYAIAAIIFALVNLISAAGGVNVRLD